MYWLRSTDLLALALSVVWNGLWVVGGWLLAQRLFGLRRGERVLAGLGIGWVLFLALTNGLAILLPLPAAAWLAGGGVLATGLALSRVRRPPAEAAQAREDWRAWLRPGTLAQLAALAALTALFTLAGRGLALYDDYLHLPLVSTLASGDFPPHFYLGPSTYFAYHYALQVWSAALVRLAGWFPWSAWDAAKGFALALTAVLAYLYLRRETGSRWAGLTGGALLLLGGGARWLLLLLPAPALAWVSGGVQLINTGLDTAPTLALALQRPWVIEGGGVVPFPFAYHAGVFVPVLSVLGATGALPFATVLLLLLTGRRRALTWPEAGVLALLLANLALSAEHLFALLWAALLLVVAGGWLRSQNGATPFDPRPWWAALGLSAALSLIQGGFITEVARGLAGQLLGLAAGQTSNAYGFSLRWPPAIYSAHLGILELFHPRQLVALLAEVGPALLLAAPASVLTWRAYRRGEVLFAAMGLAAWFNALFPVLVQYGVDRSITRLPGTALWLWLALSLPAAWRWLAARRRGALAWRALAGVAAGVTLLGGVVILAVMIANIRYPQLTYYLTAADARMAARYWNALPGGAEVLDRVPYRAVTLFGRASTAHSSIYEPLPGWQALVADPDPAAAAAAGYDYVYFDGLTWGALPEATRAAYRAGCAEELMSYGEDVRDQRLLFKVEECEP